MPRLRPSRTSAVVTALVAAVVGAALAIVPRAGGGSSSPTGSPAELAHFQPQTADVRSGYHEIPRLRGGLMLDDFGADELPALAHRIDDRAAS